MRLIAGWPLPVVRGLGALLGMLLWLGARRRRHIADVNLRLCFPAWGAGVRRRMVFRHFIAFGQAVMDRSWLWHGSPAVLAKRLQLVGDVGVLSSDVPTVAFAPHFVGLDAGGVALSVMTQGSWSSIYVPQNTQVLDEWVRQGRNRNGRNKLFFRHDGIKQIVSDLRHGGKLYLLPDMDFGPDESIFVPFLGVQAATLPSLARFARLGRAQVVTVASRMTPQGYRIEVSPPWSDFPSEDVLADTARMNAQLALLIETMPEQYHWVHRRFKTRPEGEPGVY